MWNTRQSGEDDESTDEDPTESKTQTRTIVTTWKPPHVEAQPILEQCIRLDLRGFMDRLRQHQQVRDVMVNVSRNELRPFCVLTNLDRKDWNNCNDVSVHIKKDIERIPRNLGHPSVQQKEKLFRETKVS